MRDAARVGSIRLEPGCIILAMSDGASDLFNYDHFAEHRDRYRDLLKDPEIHLTGHLLKQIEEARNEKTGVYLHHDNMTLIVVVLEGN